MASASPARVASDVGLDDLCAILYTSGSTGLPRGATLRHRNLAANTRQILAYLHLTADDSVLSVLPFHYSFGNSLLLTHFAVGGRVVVDNRFTYPSAVVETLERSRVSGFSGVPSNYAILAAKTDFLRRGWPDLRYLTQAGGGMTPALTRRLLDELPPHIRLFVMYGQTEASARLSYVPPERLREKLGSIGIAIPGVTLTIRDEDGRECAPGEVGEVVAAGENLMQGYWNDPAETALVLKDDGLHTGDLGRKDDDGFIFLVDRIKNMIKVGANRVSPREIEDVIAEVEGVAEVCVAGVPDELLGEAVEAFVVVAPGADVSAERILAHCREYLALYKVPRGVHFRDALPQERRRQGPAQRAGAHPLGARAAWTASRSERRRSPGGESSAQPGWDEHTARKCECCPSQTRRAARLRRASVDDGPVSLTAQALRRAPCGMAASSTRTRQLRVTTSSRMRGGKRRPVDFPGADSVIDATPAASSGRRRMLIQFTKPYKQALFVVAAFAVNSCTGALLPRASQENYSARRPPSLDFEPEEHE